jgi:YVTN family beta-propeller protein
LKFFAGVWLATLWCASRFKEEPVRKLSRFSWQRVVISVAALVAVAGGTALAAQQFFNQAPAMTSYGWSLHPAGGQVDLADPVWWADRPFGQGLSPDGRWLIVSSAGASNESVKLVDTATGTVKQTIAYVAPEAVNVGVVWSPDGTHAYVSAGGDDKIRAYTFAGGSLTEGASIATAGAGNHGASYLMGLAISSDGNTLYAAEDRSDSLAIVNLATSAVVHVFVGTCSEQGGPVNTSAAVPQCQPYGVALSSDGTKAYVSNWGEESVSVIDTATHALSHQIRSGIGTHPSAIRVNPKPGRHQVAVTNGDSDSVSLIDTITDSVVRTISLAPYAGAPQGSQPDALAFTPNGNTLYVANAGNNDVAVIRLEGQDQFTIAGMIPTAWYPSAVDVSGKDSTLFIANAKGMGAGPNTGYKQGVFGPPNQYVGAMLHGTLQIVAAPSGDDLAADTQQVVRSNGFDVRDSVRVPAGASSSVIPRRLGDASPIKHVIYVVKENRTYDQVFGNIGKGNGAANLTLFGDESAPNIRALAKQFVTLDNYYAVSEVSADGWSWSTEATANSYDQKTWPANYSDVNRGRGYDFEGGNYATAANPNPKDAYLWDRMADQGIAFRNYGFWTNFASAPPNVVAQTTAPNLAPRTDGNFEGYNLRWADSPKAPSVLLGGQGAPGDCSTAVARTRARICAWMDEFSGYVANGNLPAVELLRLPNDHTAGTRVGAPVPQTYVADNDYALGLLVQTVSHSPYWKNTAIFVTEDDAQDGPDHVDGHRTEALVISPYTQHGTVDSTFYSTVSMLRTMELIQGLKPMTQFDAAATPMLNAFSDIANTAPYTAVVPSMLAAPQFNASTAPMAARMAGLDMTQADNLPDLVLNQAIWEAIKGANSPMPVRASTGD